MRNVFLLLVLANLGFAAWHSWLAERSSPTTVRDAREVPGIMLVSELDGPTRELAESLQQEPTTAPDAGETAAVPSGGSRCVSVGPFRELSQAAAAAANLRAAGHEPTQRVAEGDIWVGYWVYLPGIPTRDEAEATLAQLQQNGVPDSYLAPADDGYLISLGVFSEISRAGRRREEVRALGYEPSVVDRTRRGTVYWVDVVLGEDQTLDLESLQGPGRIIRLEQRSCEAVA